MNKILSQPMHILAIAYGNPLRRDDGAGLALTERLMHKWRSSGLTVEQITTHQLVPELAASIAESDATHIIFVDTASAAVATEIQLRPLDSPQVAMTLGHQCSPNLLMYMAQHLYGIRIPAWLLTIPGTDFGHGLGLSAGVQQLLIQSDLVANAVSQLINI